MSNVTDIGMVNLSNFTTEFAYNYTMIPNITMITKMTTDEVTDYNNFTIDPVTVTTETTAITTEPTTIITEPITTTTLATTTTIITTLLIACFKPPPVSNALYTFSGFDVIYTCNSGFQMTGASRLDCDVTNGRWFGSPPACSPLDLNPRIDNTINIPETKEPIKSSDIQFIVAVIGGLLGLIALIGLLLLICYWCGCGAPICRGRVYPDRRQSCCCDDRNRRRISEGDLRVYRGNVEHTYFDSGNSLVDLENGRYVLPSKSMLPTLQDTFTKEEPAKTESNGAVTRFHHHIDDEIRSNSIDLRNKRRGSIDVRSHHDQLSSPYNNSKIYRAQRKFQAVNSWMPHSKPIRNINTSTK
ncbi:hypothetical protein LOTGIDRAFT_165191 [Lottia gigantea]|uniref:Sushi domain-containing protein n=1 Tax=Lottia gigantea TaxID=225164 RepID=V4BJ39_LOTGI|nr:hypothetical protein LOTGIDRAFT_165191 [Lottia gigantea]ESO88779.1 hypothetical protein LOTGIDRAFT_165191 [Lottia gigantea]